jgi:hypothetical protein
MIQPTRGRLVWDADEERRRGGDTAAGVRATTARPMATHLLTQQHHGCRGSLAAVLALTRGSDCLTV